ncbi:MAG: hypothetical protein ACREJ2_03195 [Planctomycetota bacterium]
MAVVEELFSGRTEILADKSTAEVPYVVHDAVDEAEVKAAVLAAAPGLYANMARTQVELVEQLTNGTWRVLVRYEKPDTTTPSEPTFSFDTGGGSQHITQSILTRGKYGPGASDLLAGAIGFDGQNVAGVDITVPVYSFSETHYIPDPQVTDAYRALLFQATGTVNADVFRGFQPGEVKFLGASGSKKGTGTDVNWEISFKFDAQPNRNDITVGAIGPITKQGWDYMWVQYATDVDNAKMQLIKKPIAVYVEQVYRTSVFANLGIGS